MKKLFVLTFLFAVLACSIVWRSAGITPLDMLYLLSQQHETDTQPQQENTIPESPIEKQNDSAFSLPVTEVRAVWVATVYAIDYPSAPDPNAEKLKARCNEILDAAKKNGCNTIYFQARPAADAFYPSKIFPWSRYLTGAAGTQPSDGFDPLAYWVEQAHARGMKLEAWVNPYRICAGENAAADFASLPDSSPAKQHPAWIVKCDGSYYFNPGLAEVRQLICDGISEIVKNYDVDGIQFDDYFYPSTEFDDADAYAAANTTLSRDDWRRDNVNQLVQAVYQTIHADAKNPVCKFGISPSGIWRNKGVNAFGGSDTNGYEHYSSAYADSVAWIQNGWIDYICPQIYWEIGYEPADFDTLTRWWAKQVNGTNVDLILGLAAYKVGSEQYGTGWQKDGIAQIGRQIDLSREVDGVNGCAIFSYKNLEQTDGFPALLQQKWAS